MKKPLVRLPEPLLVLLLSNQLSLVVTPTGAYCRSSWTRWVPFDQENLQIKVGDSNDGSGHPSPLTARPVLISKQQLVLHIKDTEMLSVNMSRFISAKGWSTVAFMSRECRPKSQYGCDHC